MSNSVIVVGAGPVGLAAALFLHERGQSVRVLEKRSAACKESKALAVNPRTLELLESSYVTEKMLQIGLPIHKACLWRENGELAAEMRFVDLPSRYPYMLALSQAVTERLLAEALAKRGVTVERDQEVTFCENLDKGARVRVANGEEFIADFILGADGSRSVVRKKLKIPFEGSSLPGDWHLADVALYTDLAPDCAHVIFRDGGGFYFAVRVVHDRNEDSHLWRIISSGPDPLLKFPRGKPIAPPDWESNFHVSHRISRELGQGNVFLAGDAAHLHSPAGARGMNLGIEDAFVFADLLASDRLSEYSANRRAIDRQVVKQVDRLSRLTIGESATIRMIRNVFLPAALNIDFLRNAIIRGLSGLDHNVA